MKKYRTGLVVGKFSPLHIGHRFLIKAAIDKCDHVIILSYSNPEFDHCEAAERERWLKNAFPEATVVVIGPEGVVVDGNYLSVPRNDEDEYIHREFCSRVLTDYLHVAVDAVFSSESYGDGFAAHLTHHFQVRLNANFVVQHVCVDINRTHHHISGTSLRDPLHRTILPQYVTPDVRVSFVPRIAVLGGESSGKTTLAAALSTRLRTLWVPEFGREYCDQIGGVDRLMYQDLLMIAQKQVEREIIHCRLNCQLGRALICDTTPLTTLFYSKMLFGTADPRLVTLAERRYDLVILCDPTIPFDQDGTRQDEQFRQQGHDWYLDHLNNDIPVIMVTGTVEERVAQTIRELHTRHLT